MPNALDRFTRRAMLARGYRSERVHTPAGAMAALVHEAERGPSLTLLHGWGSAGVHHVLTARPLRRELRRLVLPDLLGHGFSDAPSTLTPSAVDAALCHALDQLQPEPHTLVGSSLGGLAAVRYALARPDRLRRLVLVSPFGAPMADAEREALARLASGARLVDVKQFLDRLAPTSLLRNWIFAPEMKRIFRRPALQALLAHVHDMPLLSVDELRQLPMPVTVVWGTHERLLPEAHLDFWRQLPHVEVLRPPAAHSPSYETPAWFEGMLRSRLGLAA